MSGYIGVNGTARKANALFAGVDDKARRVMKAYVGNENGKARLWWESAPVPVTIYVDVWDYTNEVKPQLPNYPISTMSGADFWLEAVPGNQDVFTVSIVGHGNIDKGTSDTLKITCHSTGARAFVMSPPVGADGHFYVPAKDGARYSVSSRPVVTEVILFTVRFNGKRAGEETPYVRYQAVALPKMTVADWAKSDMVSEARVLGFTVAVQDGADAGKVKLQVTVTGTGEQFSVTCDETLVLRDGVVYDLENGFSEVDDT